MCIKQIYCIEFLSVWKTWPSRHKYWQRKPETEAAVRRLTIRLGSHPSLRAEKKGITPAFLISRTMSCYWNTQQSRGFMLQLRLCDRCGSHYGTSSPLSRLFLFFFFFLRENKTGRRNNACTLTGSYSTGRVIGFITDISLRSTCLKY